MSEPVVIEKGRVALPLSLVLAGAVAWSTWVTVQLWTMKGTLSEIAQQLPKRLASQ